MFRSKKSYLWLFLFRSIIAVRIRGTNERFIRRLELGAREAVAVALDEVSPAVSAMAHLHQASGRAEHLHARPSVQTRLGALAIGERSAGDGGRRLLLFSRDLLFK